ASYAQEESRSASENQKWRIRHGFERGELVNLRFLFGYKIEKGQVEVDPEKAEIVREVFRRALEGESLSSLATDLNRRGFTGVLGGRWNAMRIREMLSKRKILGNALLQKQYRNNHLEKKEIPTGVSCPNTMRRAPMRPSLTRPPSMPPRSFLPELRRTARSSGPAGGRPLPV
ncbi:site-specific recombinase, resolvase family, partial [human gut metagenome]